ncbi:ABC transporter permease [Dethiothermospora halolimnae]|uniref:ABC transporter permease n=1 Tax=Dethiothermospora halolimnae TaxID=3114390 RepID=UPI003CCC30BD
MQAMDIIIKDLKVMLSDKKAIGLTLIMPIILISILGTALGGSMMGGDGDIEVDIALVKEYKENVGTEKFKEYLNSDLISGNMKNEDFNNLETDLDKLNFENMFIDDFLNSEEVKKIINYKIMTKEEAIEAIDNDEISAMVVLPEDFVFDMYMNFLMPFRNKVDIKVIGNPNENIKSQIVEEIVSGFSDRVSSIIIGKNVLIETAMEEGIENKIFDDMANIMEKMTENIENYRLELEGIKVNGKKQISSYQYYAAAMTVMFILFAAGNGGRLLLEERDNKTYQRMVMAGVSKLQITIGKFFTIFTYACIQIIVLIVFSSFVLKVDWGNIKLVLLIGVLSAFAIAGLGMIIMALTYKTGNYKASDVFTAGIIHGMAFLGGSFVPLDMFPEIFKKASSLTPNGLALKAYQNIMMGYNIEEIFTAIIGLVAMGIVFTTIGVLILREKGGAMYVKHNDAETSEIKA